MRKSLFIFMCLLTMLAASTGLKAQEVTINLIPGWTWISYPKAEVMDIATALGDFVPMEGDIIKSQYSNASYLNGQWRGRLQHFTPGLGYMYYSMRGEPVTLVFGSSTPQAQVSVTTSEPMLITAISAMGGGEVTTEDGVFIIAKGLCWATHENPTTNDDFFEEAESGVGSFSLSMTGLNISTTYYVRAYAVTGNGTVYGDQKTFTTRDGIPTLTTAEVTDITGATATCGGDITDNGGLNITSRGVCWSTSPNPTVADSYTTDGGGTGSFSSSITGLSVSTTYYVRAYATTVAGTGYGEQKTFITRDGIPTITTAEVTNIGYCSAISGGTITDDGGLDILACGVCWNTSSNPTVADFHTTDSIGTDSFSSMVFGLSRNTTYYVRAYVTNSFTIVYGNEVAFTTLSEAPIGAIDGMFSVSDNIQVFFSQGNLQYQPSTNTWRFANNSWDLIIKSEDMTHYMAQYMGGYYFADVTSHYKSTYNGWIDLIGWGTSNYNHGANCYRPWSTSQTNSDYYAYGSYTYNLYDQTGQADWGYNPITNGGNTTNQWRTLTQSEWNYLFNIRNTMSGIRYSKAIVNGVNGIIILPDDWNNSTYNLSNTNSGGASYNSNTLTTSQWNVLKQAGAVFLPAAGYRDGTKVRAAESGGNYWSALYYNDSNACYVNFGSSNLNANTNKNNGRCYGFSVRLVCDVR